MEIIKDNPETGKAQLFGLVCDYCNKAELDDELEDSFAMDRFLRIVVDDAYAPALDNDWPHLMGDFCPECVRELLADSLKPKNSDAPGFAYHREAGYRISLADYQRIYVKGE